MTLGSWILPKLMDDHIQSGVVYRWSWLQTISMDMNLLATNLRFVTKAFQHFNGGSNKFEIDVFVDRCIRISGTP